MVYRFFICDDIALQITHLKLCFRSYFPDEGEFEVEGSISIEPVLERLRAGQTYTAIFVDYKGPSGPRGHEFIRRIREIDSETPVYLISGEDGLEDVAKDCGATGFHDKREKIDPLLDELLAES
tara:strand:+ start:254 stop:625 length:372 start_codon:yes stop_codon:yes gene_type:complete